MRATDRYAAQNRRARHDYLIEDTLEAGLVSLLAIVPAFVITTGSVKANGAASAVFCILWILKLGTYAPAMSTLGRVIANERATLASVLVIFIIIYHQDMLYIYCHKLY
jgi:hypothetical protein